MEFLVFLGGSCNPTTWRTEIAIPMLKKLGITYYNPQVARWRPELVELEYNAKQRAKILFFVIDNKTRAIVSMIESAYIAGSAKKLILVIEEFPRPGTLIYEEAITEKEYKDLEAGQRFLRHIVERQGIPVFEQIPAAVSCVSRMLRDGLRPQEVSKRQLMVDKSLREEHRPFRDVYLGGPSFCDSNWRQEIAIPVLKQHGLTYYTPQNTNLNDDRLISLETSAIDRSRVLLFVISKESRSVASMVLAAHYISLGCCMALCVQYLDNDCVVGDESMTKLAIDDYNRGRFYLTDLAKRANVSVFDDIREAVKYCVRKCISDQ